MDERVEPSEGARDKFFIVAIGSGPVVVHFLELSDEEMKAAYAGLGEDYMDAYSEEPSSIPGRLLRQDLEQTRITGGSVPDKIDDFFCETSESTQFFIITRNLPPGYLSMRQFLDARKEIFKLHEKLTL